MARLDGPGWDAVALPDLADLMTVGGDDDVSALFPAGELKWCRDVSPTPDYRPPTTRQIMVVIGDADPVECTVRMPAWVADELDAGRTVPGLDLDLKVVAGDEGA